MDTSLGLMLAAVITGASTVPLRFIANKAGLLDAPSERKKHIGNVPLIGGIAIFFGFFIVVASSNLDNPYINSLLVACSLLVIIGVIDDIRPQPVRVRVTAQLIASTIMIFGTGLHITSFGNLLGMGEIDLGILAIPVTLLAVVGVTNAFNLVDGINGLAGSLTIISIGGVIVFNGGAISSNSAAVLIILCAAIIPYLILNIWGGKYRIFLGDGGSLFIGFVICWVLIDQTQGSTSTMSPVSALWCIAIPLVDTIGVMARRIAKKQSPFQPDRNHLHHILMRVGLSDKGALVFLVAMASLILLLGFVIEKSIPSLSFIAFIGVFLGYYLILKHSWKVQRFLKR